MKTMRFLFAVVGLGGLTLGITFADPPSNQSSGQDSSQNHSTGDQSVNPGHGTQTNGTGGPTDKKLSQTNAGSHAPEKTSQTAQTKTPPQKPSGKNPSQPAAALNKTTTVAKAGLPVNKPASNSVELTKPPVGGGTTALGPNIFRKPTGPTASIGGLTASSIKTSTAGINGTGMQRTTPR